MQSKNTRIEVGHKTQQEEKSPRNGQETETLSFSQLQQGLLMAELSLWPHHQENIFPERLQNLSKTTAPELMLTSRKQMGEVVSTILAL